MGFGDILLLKTIELCKSNSIKCMKLEVSSNNYTANQFYLSHGFVVLHFNNDSTLMEKTFSN